MFKEIVPAQLKSVSLAAPDQDMRIAYCRFHVTLDYTLAKQVHKKFADRLYRLNSKQEWEPCLELKNVVFDDIRIAPQVMEFMSLPNVRIPGARIPGVEIRKVSAIHMHGASDLTMVMDVKFRFPLNQTVIASKLIIDHLGQSVHLSFAEQQKSLDLEEKPEARYIPPQKDKVARGAGAHVS